MNCIYLNLSNCRVVMTLFISLLMIGCGSGGGDRAGLLTYSASGVVSGDVLKDVVIQLTGATTKSALTDANGIYSLLNLANGGRAQKPSATFKEDNVAWEKFTSS